MDDELVFRCGHTGRTPDGVTNKEAHERLCALCYFASQAASAGEWAAQEGLPAIKGSEAQCVWAVTIRRRLVTEARWCLGDKKDVSKNRLAAFDAMRGKRAASWWINRRDCPAAWVLSEIETRTARKKSRKDWVDEAPTIKEAWRKYCVGLRG